ncbi:hypothetical protein FACS1894187_24930 [Synergistales bacterium]|nr:hypothetical protein FACS1894187_24930 [Synergistales bacterium]
MKKKKELLTSIAKISFVLCLLITTISACWGGFFYPVNISTAEKNKKQQTDFTASKRVLDTVNDKFIERFDSVAGPLLKTRLAQSGYVALIDKSVQISLLYGYTDLQNIVSNKINNPTVATVTNPKKFNWPTVKLISFVFDSNSVINKCTAMVEISGGEIPIKQKRKMWRFTKTEDGKWKSAGEVQTSEYTARDVEITKQGISFALSPRNDSKLTKVFVLNKKESITPP